MRGIFSLAVVIIVVLAMPSITVFGASQCHRFTHNDHDTLLLGEITALADDTMVIKPTGFIVSAGDNTHDTRSQRRIASQLREETARQVRPDEAVVHRTAQGWWWPWPAEFSVGDYVIASLNINPEGDGFVIAHGIYIVDALDYQTLTVSAGNFLDLSERYTAFVNSRGYGGHFIAVGESPPGNWRAIIPLLMIIISIGAAVALTMAWQRKMQATSNSTRYKKRRKIRGVTQ